MSTPLALADREVLLDESWLRDRSEIQWHGRNSWSEEVLLYSVYWSEEVLAINASVCWSLAQLVWVQYCAPEHIWYGISENPRLNDTGSTVGFHNVEMPGPASVCDDEAELWALFHARPPTEYES